MVCELAAFAGLHDDDRNIALCEDLIELAGVNDLVVPVSVVELDLYELDLRVIVYDLNEEFGRAVERETEVLDLAFFPLLNSPVEAVILNVCVVVVAVFDAVQKIEIEVVDAAPFELLIEDLVAVFE